MNSLLARIRRLPPAETIALVVAIVVIAILTVATQQTSQGPQIASYSTYDADSGGTRAYYELLQREGVRVDRFEQQTVFLGPSIDTFVWVDSLDFDERQRFPTEAETDALEQWVRNGGNFLYVGHDAGAAKQGILKLPTPTTRKIPGARAFVDPTLRADGIGSIADESERRWIVKKNSGKRVLVSDARGPIVVRYAYGKGTITAVVDQGLFSNDGIGIGDRARLAYALAVPQPDARVAFDEESHGHFVPEHWWQIAPRPFVVAVIVALAALAIAVIGAAIRLGPPLVPVARDDASTSDFIGALAGLLGNGGARRDAMVAAARSTSQALARSFGLGDRATVDEISARIERDDLRRDYATMLAVTSNGFPGDANLVRGVALAQRLRKELASHVDRRR